MAARKAWLAKVRQPGFKPSDLLEEEPAGGAKQAGSGLLGKVQGLHCMCCCSLRSRIGARMLRSM